MITINQNAIYGSEEFAFSMMWGAHGVRDLHVTNPDDVRLAVNKAYIDMTPRTITGLGLGDISDKDVLDEKKRQIDALKKWLTGELVEVFKNNRFDDLIHKKLCTGFITEFQKCIGDIQKMIIKKGYNHKIDPDLITYGKAQKIVNMSFKYLYLFSDAWQYTNSIFEKCHMAIDANILAYFKKKTKIHASVYDVTWSNMNIEAYDDCQDAIRQYCSQNGQLIYTEYVNKYGVSGRISSKEMTVPFYAETYIFDMMLNP